MARKSRKHLLNTSVAVQATADPKPMYSAGAYVRLSALDKRTKGDSIETQQAIIKTFIAGCDDIELREIYIEMIFSSLIQRHQAQSVIMYAQCP